MTDAKPRLSEKQVASAERAADEQKAALILELMARPIGREWLHDLLRDTHVFHSTFALNAVASAYAEGERNVGLRILSQITTPRCIDFFGTMLKEAKEREDARSRPDASTGSADAVSDAWTHARAAESRADPGPAGPFDYSYGGPADRPGGNDPHGGTSG